MDEKKTNTDPRVVRTRQLIRDAFVELLQEMDIEKLSVNRIAERATINRVTFYLHYRDIPDMMEKMADDMIQEIEAILEKPSTASSDDEGDMDGTILLNLLEHIASHAAFYKVVLASKRTPVFTDRLLKLLKELITVIVDRRGSESNLSKAGIQKDIAIWYSSSALIGTIVAWLRHDMPYTPRYMAEQFSLLRRHPHRFDE
ncbi:TetR/AcrR family transcriptional regulator C-terminal domain-containing protein [Paenibacillus sp. LHD-117]|uniref:TetR/AcrR family transcriptional regulator n=1 Tax=Paenibacillus sp. LHD-117 TaxID=3071412 RepID=UPI0027DF1E5E|nr:TetR/AcrR family transcriptional regulator C-terminal domain-containing protein [Paenibacillus sp. LHD-117]MDQ6420409.1 TetR/AcrR family transcriptional regulator C-terminal domain-containing protein [Paenibacillus sp. LHD-117]